MGGENIKSIVKNSTITKPIYHLIRNIKELYRKKRRKDGIKVFEKSSLIVMKSIQDIFQNYPDQLDYFFAYGTLLGIIRDGKLLSRDMDLDMVVFLENDEKISEFRKFLKKNGFKRLHSFYIDNVGINQDAFIFQNVMVDINYAKPAGNRYYNYNFYDLPEEKNKVLIFPFTYSGSEKYTFESISINIPKNPDIYLEETYGKEWKIPNPKYIYWENPQTIKTELKGRVENVRKFKYR